MCRVYKYETQYVTKSNTITAYVTKSNTATVTQ